MRRRNIPNTDLHASVICLGALPFGLSVGEALSFSLMDRFFAAGGNFIDTALVYGEWLPDGKGQSERTVGMWLKQRGNRQRVIISTKGAHPRLTSMQVPRLGSAEIIADLDESLRNLQTDYIDLYWLHRDDPQRPVGDILTTLNEQVQAGKIGYFGCSNWRLDRIRAAQQYAAEQSLQGFVGNQLWWSLATPNPEAVRQDPTIVVMDDELRSYHLASGMAVMAYTAGAKGFFSRLHHTPMDELPQKLRLTYDNAINSARARRVAQLAQERELSVNALVLAYLIAQPFATFPLSGCSNRGQLEENLQAGDMALDATVLRYLESGA